MPLNCEDTDNCTLTITYIPNNYTIRSCLVYYMCNLIVGLVDQPGKLETNNSSSTQPRHLFLKLSPCKAIVRLLNLNTVIFHKWNLAHVNSIFPVNLFFIEEKKNFSETM